MAIVPILGSSDFLDRQNINDNFEGLEARLAVLEAGTFIAQAERETLSTYGDTVSVAAKAKSLLKFGSSTTIGTTIGTVWATGTLNETYVTTNAIDRISSSSASDTVQMTIEGHTVSGTGASAQFTFVIQTVTLDGQNKVTLTTPLARVSRLSVAGSTNLVGIVRVYEDTAISSGVPTDTTKIHIRCDAGANQSAKAATTFSDTDYAFITSATGSVVEKTSAAVDFTLEVRDVGGVFRVKRFFSAANTSGTVVVPFQPYLIVPKNADVRIRALASGANTDVSASFAALLAAVQ